ncbi:MAG: cob(I)yrinic acid a,c-diamide adenosyltransferase [Thermosipho sp. (in: Bacteria)]|nr:cob(I)yrinic acid a,c-diamide adenosyltransferase [Thermosipho sp. (in: thermotogales)]
MITTKLGDGGNTRLANGEMVSKDHARVEAYGTLDELDSFLGFAKNFLSENEKQVLEKIQRMIFSVSAELAKVEKHNKLIDEEDIEELTALVQQYEKNLDLKGFVLVGSTKESALVDICRTIARRAERRIVALSKTESVRKEILAFINRVSDLLFVIARFIEKQNKENKK